MRHNLPSEARQLEDWGTPPTRTDTDKTLARVVRVDRGECDVITADGKLRVASAPPQPATGDWVLIGTQNPTENPTKLPIQVTQILPRTTTLSRHDPAERDAKQVLAANVDTVGIVVGLDKPIAAGRFERLAILALESGANAIVILSKADLCDDVKSAVAEVKEIISDLPVIVTTAQPYLSDIDDNIHDNNDDDDNDYDDDDDDNDTCNDVMGRSRGEEASAIDDDNDISATDSDDMNDANMNDDGMSSVKEVGEGEGVEALRTYIRRGETLALIGPSGAGKSTLINALAGQELVVTGAVREKDLRGRHTTVARELVLLPDSSGIIMDTPGLRTLGLWNTPQALKAFETVFADVVELAIMCRFSDCAHDTEPDCAVKDAVANGEISEARVERAAELQAELSESSHLQRSSKSSRKR